LDFRQAESSDATTALARDHVLSASGFRKTLLNPTVSWTWSGSEAWTAALSRTLGEVITHDARAIRDRLVANLNSHDDGRALCAVVSAPQTRKGDGREGLSRFLFSEFGLDVAPTSLEEVSRVDALFVATELLLGPVWGRRATTRSGAERLAEAFVALFGDGVAFYSTYAYRIDHWNATYTATGARLLDNSFELGIMVADESRVGILWLGDED
jgi:hypothetical protein